MPGTKLQIPYNKCYTTLHDHQFFQLGTDTTRYSYDYKTHFRFLQTKDNSVQILLGTSYSIEIWISYNTVLRQLGTGTTRYSCRLEHLYSGHL